MATTWWNVANSAIPAASISSVPSFGFLSMPAAPAAPEVQ